MAIRYAGNSKGIENFLAKGLDFGSIGSQGVVEDAKNAAQTAMNNMKVSTAGIAAAAKVEAAKHWADNSDRASSAAQRSAGIGGVLDGISGGLSMAGRGGFNFGGGSSFGNSGWGSFGDYSGGLSGTPLPGLFSQ